MSIRNTFSNNRGDTIGISDIMRVSRRYIVILAAVLSVAAIGASAAFISTSSGENVANAEPIYDGGSPGGGGGGWGGRAGDIWVLGSWDANESGVDAAFATEYHGTSVNGGVRTDVINMTKTLVANCRRDHPGQCNSPRLVSIGWTQTTNGWCGRGACPSHETSTINTKPWYGESSLLRVYPNTVIRTGKDLEGANSSIYRRAMRGVNTNKNSYVVVIAEYAVAGYKPKTSTTHGADLKSLGNDTSNDLTECPTDYQVNAEGFDGYAKGLSSASKNYHTQYGYLWDAINQGKDSWTNTDTGEEFSHLNAEKQSDYTTKPDAATARSSDVIKKAHDSACKSTYKMKISYDLEGDGGETGKTLNKQFAKGGQYKLIKRAKYATITVRQRVLNYQWRTSDLTKYEGIDDCQRGTDGCYDTKEAAEAAGKSQAGYKVSGWKNVADGDKTWIRALVDNGGGSNAKINGRQLWSVYSSSNEHLASNTSGSLKWDSPAQTSKDKWSFGSSTGFIDGSKYHGVANDKQSPVRIAIQDFLNVNCNQKDFEALVKWESDQGLEPTVVQDTRYNGFAYTKVMTGLNVEQKMWRAMEVFTGVEGLNPTAYTANKYPGLSKLRAEWKTATGDTAGDADPVYTKECPYDCTADTKASTLTKTNVRTNGASSDDLKKDSYGMLVKLPKKTGDEQYDASEAKNPFNTADAVVFRNNEWAELDFDRWVPVSGDGITYKNTPATTTTFVRDTTGTPWKIDDKVLTKLRGGSDGSSWTDIAFKDSGSEGDSNQWSGSNKASHENHYKTDRSAQIVGDITKIQIKSPWATDQDKPLRFNVKWEYITDDSVKVVSKWEVAGNGTNTGNSATPSFKDVSTEVDGKCEAQWHNAGQKYVDHQTIAQQQTGRDVKNGIDMDYRGNTDLIGWFSVTFDRATGE